MEIEAVASDAVGRLSKLIIEEYVETDEDIGPRVRRFEVAEAQLQLIGEELTNLRDASSASHAAHMALSRLCDATAAAADASVHAYGERQEGRARLAQTLAAQYDRFVSISVNQLEGLALVVANKYRAYRNKVIEMRRRKAQLQACAAAGAPCARRN